MKIGACDVNKSYVITSIIMRESEIGHIAESKKDSRHPQNFKSK